MLPAFDTPHCVGRDAELDLVRSLVHDAALGNGGALVWLGESGIGKSRLLQECARLPLAAVIVRVRCGGPRVFLPNVCEQIATGLRSPGGAKGRSIPAVLATIVARAKRRPIALFIDDLHLAGSRELEFIDALIARTVHHRVVVVACAAAGRPVPAMTRELAPLDDPVMEVLVRSCSSARTIAADDVRAVVATAQGNPGLGIELVRRLREGGKAPLVADSAREAVAKARAVLSPVDFDVVLACSVIGDSFESDWLPEITQRPRSEVADALQRASEIGLLESDNSQPGKLSFRKVAVRNALYASLVVLKRQILHERVVERLTRLRSANGVFPAADIDALMATHAEIVGKCELAVEAFAGAAARQRADAAFGAAAQLYARAAANAATGDSQWASLLREALLCYRKVGDWKAVQRVGESLLARLDPAQHASMVGGVLDDMFLAYLNDGDRAAAGRTAEQIAAVGLPNSAIRAGVASLILAYGLCYNGMTSEARRLAGTVTPEHFHDDELRFRHLIAMAEIDALVTPLDLTLQRIDEAIELARGLGIRGTVMAAGSGAEIACRFGDLEKAREYERRSEEIAATSAGTVNAARRHAVKGWTRISMLAGDLAAVRRLVASNLAWRESGRHNEAFDAGFAVSVGMHVGDLALVDAFFDPQLLHDSIESREAESCGLLLPGFAEVMVVRGMVKELRSALERCVEYELIDPYASIQIAAARYASAQCAAIAVEQVQSYFKGAIAPAACAHIALVQAMLLRRQLKHIAAGERATLAATRYRGMGWRLHEAIALELGGNARAASRVYRQCGASSDVARLASGETRKRKYAPFGARLSPREHEVARLVAGRRSNRDIAIALDISVRTVDHHVEAAFSKLGIRNRWQLDPSMLDSR